MRMKNRFSKMGKTLFGAVCLLSMGGITYSCSDDYDLDETMPSFLGGSIYDELKKRDFTNVVKLIEDLDYKEVLAKTGSKTLFAADDEAFARFFASTTWKGANGEYVRKYEDLTNAQKRWLLNGAMLNSAYVSEMLANLGSEKNMCLRQGTALTAVDTIPFWTWEQLPQNLNEGELNEEGVLIGDRKFWEEAKKGSTEKGLYMAIDKSSPMLTHFIEGHMKEHKITKGDVAFILNKDSIQDSSYVYDCKLKEPDVTCLNGYIHILDDVLVTPSNMAEVIRTNGKTNLFSAMLERFSAPYYDYDLTRQYKDLYQIDADSVFYKRYISERALGNAKITMGPDKKSLGDFPYLPFDPGWNELTSSTTVASQKDMAAMFVPTDEAMEKYFIAGGGKVLMDRYAKKPNTPENLEYNLFQVPLDKIAPLLSNLMKDSFRETVPSKYLTIMNDAQDQMFPASDPKFASLDAYKQNFDGCLLANNGVIYLLKDVVAPADYASVIAPALFSENTKVVNTVARADDNYIQGNSYDQAPLKRYYSTYLKAMQSRFSFFVPTDEGLGSYGLVDPMSLAKGKPADERQNPWRYWRVSYKNAANSKLPLFAQAYRYNMEAGQNPGSDPIQTAGGKNNNVSEPDQAIGSGSGLVKKFLMIDMMDQHIVVHENDDLEGINSNRAYFTSRGGAPVMRVGQYATDKENGVGTHVVGGFQLQLKEAGYKSYYESEVVEGYNMTQEKNGYGNGMTYLIDRPMQPTTNSVYAVMSAHKESFEEFFKLCNSEFDSETLEIMGLKDSINNESDWKAEQNKYRIFTDQTGYNPAQTYNNEKLIRFFNNYRYTVYVPTNDAMKAAYAAGLPTQDDIYAFVEANKIPKTPAEGEEGSEDLGYTLSDANKLKAQAMLATLVNFVKYHFQDQAFYVDQVSNAGKYQTSCAYSVSGDPNDVVYLELEMKQTPGAIEVVDRAGFRQTVIKPYNLLARDANYDRPVKNTATSIANSSYAVLHQIAKPLYFKKLSGDRFDTEWATPAKAKAFLAKYRILK